MRHLVGHEKDQLIRWFITYMDGKTRRQLAGDMPVIYKLLFPDVDDSVIIYNVNQRFAEVAEQRDLIPPISTPNLLGSTMNNEEQQ